MSKFEDNIHTAEALSVQIESLRSSEADMLLIGSLGRAGVYSLIMNNPLFEFNTRGQSPLKKGETARDIDVIAESAFINSDPFKVDSLPAGTPLFSLNREGMDWWVVSTKRNFSEPLHPAVMEPLEVEIPYGIRCTTIPAQTHVALYGMQGAMRKQDQQTKALLEETVLTARMAQLPSNMYEPFDKLRVLNSQGLYHALQHTYRFIVPDTWRQKAGPVTSWLKYRIIP
jgi:hypothetical protein